MIQPETSQPTFQEFFNREGFLVLPKFFDDDFITKVQHTIDSVKRERPYDVVIDNLENGDRTVLGLMSPESVKHDRMKLYDLYLKQPLIRDLALSPNLITYLQPLLGQIPALCHSLYLEKGSAQDPHVDALYMTPRTPFHLIAAWVALEDTHEDAGELEYFPGSHVIEPMIFSNGGLHYIESEMPQWREYIDQSVKRNNLQKLRFKAKKGDVFIWHGNFLHGGGHINNLALTRKSIVFHYYSEVDASGSGCSLVPQSGAFWIDRPPQSLPPHIAAQLPFDEQAYLRRYPDVAGAVNNRQFENGRHHYDLFGKNEGRLPC